jgi:hypothetical protein
MAEIPPFIIPVAEDLATFLRTLPIVKDVSFEQIDEDGYFFTYVRAKTNTEGKVEEKNKHVWPESGLINLEYKIDGDENDLEIVDQDYGGMGLMVRIGTSHFPTPLPELNISENHKKDLMDLNNKVREYLGKKYERKGSVELGCFAVRPPRAIIMG